MDIKINTQSSILLCGDKMAYFDPWKLGQDAPIADIIFLTHEHFDHFSPDDIARICGDNTVIVAPKSVGEIIKEKCGAPDSAFLFVEPGKSYTANGIDFDAVGSYNVGKAFHPKEKGYCGYAVTLEGKKYFVMGDTDENEDNRCVKCDVLLIPVGGKYTMNYREAALCAYHINPKIAIPTHYGEAVGDPSDGKSFCRALKELSADIEVIIKMD